MSRDTPPGGGLLMRLVLIGAAVTAMVALVVTLPRWRDRRGAEPQSVPVILDASSGAPIPGEAEVFSLRPTDVAVEPWARRRGAAHPRTLATTRALRAYPGAPPRVPHGLTSEEFRTTECNTCHQRGGYSQRFGTYAPVTPHPEMRACLQCHATDNLVVGVALPGRDPDGVCRQCHVPGTRREVVRALDWQSAPWPLLARASIEPPPIPHDLQLRGNCLACHMGPGAIAEIRMTHADHANCRQCHVVLDPDAGDFVRPRSVDGTGSGGAP